MSNPMIDMMREILSNLPPPEPAKVLVCSQSGWDGILASIPASYPSAVWNPVPLLAGLQVYIDHDPAAPPWELVDAEEYYARVRGAQAAGRSDNPSTPKAG